MNFTFIIIIYKKILNYYKWTYRKKLVEEPELRPIQRGTTNVDVGKRIYHIQPYISI